MVEFVQQFSDIYPVEKLVKKGNCCANSPNKKKWPGGVPRTSPSEVALCASPVPGPSKATASVLVSVVCTYTTGAGFRNISEVRSEDAPAGADVLDLGPGTFCNVMQKGF
jgi:hypothetical protein